MNIDTEDEQYNFYEAGVIGLFINDVAYTVGTVVNGFEKFGRVTFVARRNDTLAVYTEKPCPAAIDTRSAHIVRPYNIGNGEKITDVDSFNICLCGAFTTNQKPIIFAR